MGKTTLDLVGLCCSVPQLMVYSRLKKMREGDVLEIVVEANSSQEQDVKRVLEYFQADVRVERQGDRAIYTVVK